MQPDGEGRFCERCELHVTDVASLDADGLDSLLANGGRVCARFELERGQPRTKLGIAAGVMVMALAGCATPAVSEPPREPSFIEPGPVGSGGVISGIVSDRSGAPVANAVVILMSSALTHELELLTNDRGIYSFKDLPPGHYTIQVFAGKANVSKIVTMPQDARFRAHFAVDTAQDMLLGMLGVGEPSMIDTTSASSTYSSRMIQYR
jgi:hypothetical protein